MAGGGPKGQGGDLGGTSKHTNDRANEDPDCERVAVSFACSSQEHTHTHMAAKSTVLERIILKVRSKAQQVSQNPSSAD